MRCIAFLSSAGDVKHPTLGRVPQDTSNIGETKRRGESSFFGQRDRYIYLYFPSSTLSFWNKLTLYTPAIKTRGCMDVTTIINTIVH